MKKFLLLLSFALFSFAASAQANGGSEIILKPIIKPEKPRSAQIAPKVYLDQSCTKLSIKFFAPSDSYDLIVEDQSGGVVCQWALITDGAFYFYSLPDQLTSGEYSVRIESRDAFYEGYFYLP